MSTSPSHHKEEPSTPAASSRRSALAALIAGIAAGLETTGGDARRSRRKRRRPEHGPGTSTADHVHEEKKKKKKGKKKGNKGKTDTTPAPGTTRPPTGGAGGLLSPVPAGISYRVNHGYNDPKIGEPCPKLDNPNIDHCDNQRYGLDLDTSSREIVAPGAGVVAWIEGECLGIRLTDGGANLTICHFATYKVSRDQPVKLGQCLGTKESHIHLNLYGLVADNSKPPIEFTGRYQLEGRELSFNGVRSQWEGESFRSTNPGFCSTTGTGGIRIEAAVSDLTVDRVTGAVLPYNPVHRTIPAEVELRNVGNQISRLTVNVTYESSIGAYVGIADLPSSVQPGIHTAKIKFRDRVRTLPGQVPDIFNILPSATTTIPRVTLIPGDVNEDSKLTNADYDAAAACYTYPGNPETCSGAQFKAADADDNGTVNEFDLNLILRAMSR